MPWQEVSVMSQREELVALARNGHGQVSALSRQFGVSRKTVYKWLQRFAVEGAAGLRDRSRRPRASPTQTPPAVEQAILSARQAHPAWGARKLRHWLAQSPRGSDAALPAPSTITAILRRHRQLDPQEALKHQPFQRFEHAAPNDLWQMDFKGWFAFSDRAQTRCHPLTVLDDHSRYALGLRACLDQRGGTVQAELSALFRRYGLPWRMTMDNGSPWGDDAHSPFTALTVWLLRLEIQVSHSRPYHPQTQGKDERFHRTLQAELLHGCQFADQARCQAAFDAWRTLYNLERPHQALDYLVPAQRYQPSARPFPEPLPPIAYGPDDQVRQVQDKGEFSFRGRTYRISRAFRGYPIALRPLRDDVWQVWFCRHALGSIDLQSAATIGSVTHVSEHL